ncbi:MAG TPA: SPOR domain-containing protein [Terracidiphilus sp.]|nr:SPOR domain-containing protein [Terracidiphilus sp.]
MRGIFDNDEVDDEPQPKLEERGRDREVTLSTAAQLGIVFCLLLLCGACFGLGYWVGHRGSPATAANQPATPAPDQEPLQGSDTAPKPSADAQVPPSQPSPQSSATTPEPNNSTSPAPAPERSPEASHPNPAPPAEKPATPHPSQPSAAVQRAPRSHTTEPARPEPRTRESEPEYRSSIRPAPPAIRPAPAYAPAGQYVVQIAAVSHFEDANVLVEALRRRGYAATEQHMSDGLIHVRIGPFATHDEANRMCMRLLESGYNAMVQP